MLRAKILIGLSVVLLMLTVFTLPAVAIFKSGETTGHGALGSGTSTFGYSGVITTCTADTGEWKIRSAGAQFEAQTEVLEGPHQLLHVSYTGCTTPVAGLKLATEVGGSTKAGGTKAGGTACQFELKQPTKGTNRAVFDVDLPCAITIPLVSCTITFPAFNETTGTNFQLTQTTLANAAGNLTQTLAITGLTYTVSAGCANANITAGNNGTHNSTETSIRENIV